MLFMKHLEFAVIVACLRPGPDPVVSKIDRCDSQKNDERCLQYNHTDEQDSLCGNHTLLHKARCDRHITPEDTHYAQKKSMGK